MTPLQDLYKEGLENSPDKPAIIVDDAVCTYRDLHTLSEKWGQALLGCGIQKGDRVSILMPNRIEYMPFYFACYRIGAVASPLSCYIQSRADEIVFATRLIESSLLMVSEEYYSEVADLKKSVPSLKHIFVMDDVPDKSLSWPAFVQSERQEIPWPSVEPSDPALIVFTSGSTSMPKGVTHTHRSLVANAVNKNITLEHDHRDIYLIATLLCHASGSFGFSLPVLMKGGTLIFMRSHDTKGFLALLRKHRPTHVVAVPAELREMLPILKEQPLDFTSIKTFRSGGDTVSLELLEQFKAVTGLDITESYGSTECEECCMNPPYGRKKPGSFGLPVHGTEMRLVDDAGRDVSQGQEGEILIRNEAMMKGYWKDEENTRKAFRDGWLATGDLARQDEDGYFFFVGRKKSIIVRAGGNIAPGEVENVINSHPKVKVSGVVGARDEMLGQVVHAFVVVDPEKGVPPTAEELAQFAGTKLSAFKLPDRWTFVESLPLNSIGKIDRKKLGEFAARENEQ
jgi:acyl-coenzyme A synthetase/AMP-(fatty) acid ligase